jgi:aconitase B
VCYRKFNQPENSKPYYKTQATKDFLQEEFDAKPQRTAKQVHERMKAKKMSDGGAYFSFSQRAEYADWPGCSMCGKKPCQCHG